ncbi:MAG: hypothetical protein IJW22_08710 [Clostridia bacterium]|nr:hypothetical protein [Clostridia bacterium]
MYVKIAAELALAALSVFGLYALLRLLVTARFSPARVRLLLQVMPEMTVQQVTELIQIARDERFFYPDAPLFVLVREGADTGVIQLLQEQGIDFCIFKKS